MNNIRVAEKCGLGLAVYTPEGVTQEIFDDAIKRFREKRQHQKQKGGK